MMENSYSESYKAAGVDVTAGYRAVELMKAHVARTMTKGALGGLGGLAACLSWIYPICRIRCSARGRTGSAPS